MNPLAIILQITTTAVADSTSASAGHPAQEELTLFSLLLKGGYVMIPLLLLSLFSVYLFVERWLYIKQASKVDDRFLQDIKDKLGKGNVKEAIAQCERERTPIAKMLEKGLNRLGSPIRDIESAIENMANIQISNMEKNLSLLAAIAAIAPMLGFLGTVLGMIKAFYNISLADNISIGIIASGIYEKMVTSATGLIVGVIAHIFFTLLNNMIDRSVNKMEYAAIDFVDTLYKPAL